MRKAILTATALVLYSSAVMAQSTDTKSPASTGPAAQSDSMSKGDMSKDKISMAIIASWIILPIEGCFPFRLPANELAATCRLVELGMKAKGK
jgi:hypothetical protein